jgi:hypothetical protein
MRIAFTPEHIRRSLGWIIAGTQNDYIRAGELRQQSLKIMSIETRTKSCAGWPFNR